MIYTLLVAITIITIVSSTITIKEEEEDVIQGRLLLGYAGYDPSKDMKDMGDKDKSWCDKEKARRKKNKRSYWEKSGWLPKEDKIHKWFKNLNKTLNYDIKTWDPSIIKLYHYIEYNPVIRQGVETMIYDAIQEHGTDTPIQTVIQMCCALNGIIPLTPAFSNDPDDPLIGVPIAALFADVATNHAGHSMFQHSEFNKQLTSILITWMNYLDSRESFTVSNNGNWLSQEAKDKYDFDNYVTELKNPPYWTSWNNFFTRDYKPGIRKNYGEGDDTKIQLTNDGVQVRYQFDIEDRDIFWLKDMAYSLHDIFGFKHNKYVDVFEGGSIFQSYLDPFNYHNYNTPVDGIVIESYVLDGAYFPQLVWQFDIADEGAGTLSLPWLLEVNARGIFIIDTNGYMDIGMVCIVAIGMGEVSSVNFFPKIGDIVKKGEQFGAFKFGGSSIALITEDMSKYGKVLEYESKFIPEPTENDHITFFVGEIMGTVQDKKSAK